MKSYALLTLCAGALLAGCASNTAPVRTEPTYQEAASSQFLQSSAEAIGKRSPAWERLLEFGYACGERWPGVGRHDRQRQ